MKALKKLGLVSLLLLLMVSLVACGGGEADEEAGLPDESAEKMIIGCDVSYVPFEYLNQDTGEYEGFDIDIWNAIAEECGFNYEFQPMDFNGIIPALQSGSIDGAIAAMTINEERAKKVDFSVPYYDAGLLVLVRADEEEIQGVEDLVGKKVATKTGTTSYDYATAIEGIGEVVPFPNIDNAYMELINEGADAVIFDKPNVLYYTMTKGKDKVKVVGDVLEAGEQFGIAFPKDSELTPKVDEALNKMFEDGTYVEIYKKWFGTEPESLPKAE
ncbi:MAG TPA: transporter substrate-binding domain-containing protein [Clostridia bacterium]|nr:transporter substrate-binding domain-containing protein [Clostridia bacterium]